MSTHPPVTLSSQVGGHAGVLCSEDGSLVFKPALPLEIEFYQHMNANASLDRLQSYIPRFFGTLKLEGVLQTTPTTDNTTTSVVQVVPIEDPPAGTHKDEPTFTPDTAIVLENLSYPFKKPNLLDIKLGTVLYDEDASEDKRLRMLEAARRTTSLETGVRLTGFQVYSNVTNEPVNTTKAYGKSITSSELPAGVALFFPRASSGSGLPQSVLLPILQSIKEGVQELRENVAKVEMRMVGASLLLIYEGDWDQAQAGLDILKETKIAALSQEASTAAEKDKEEDEEDDEDEEDGDDDVKGPGVPFVVKLIDFAHTRFKPGEGPDQGVLLGFDTVLRLLAGRIEEIKAIESP